VRDRPRTTRTALLALLAGIAAPALGAQQTLGVGPGSPYPTISAALRDASAGDTIRVASGTYREKLRIERPVTLVGEGWPVVDAGGTGHVVEALAPLEIRGFVLRGSGFDVDQENAGVIARGATVKVLGNRLEDVLYGIYLKQAPGSQVVGNRIHGKPLAPARRGDGIRLWYSPGSRVTGNDVRGARDVVAYFSDHLVLEDNVIRGGRYGLHYMYSHHSRLVGNRLYGNQVGAFLMYSNDIELIDNVFAEAEGPSGMGLGLKDSDAVAVRGNLFLENSIGVHLDNSPSSRDRVNDFDGNTFALNGAAVRMLPSVTGNRFYGNDFLANDAPARVAGGARTGQVRQNDWSGNHWSEYAGFDRDGDGVGDAPYVHAHLADDLLERRPALRIFALAPALDALDALVRSFPLLRPEPVVADPVPRLSIQAARRWQEEWPGRGASGWAKGAVESAGWALAAVAALGALGAGSRRGERHR
jgi:nitrous oxidase accessory protein